MAERKRLMERRQWNENDPLLTFFMYNSFTVDAKVQSHGRMASSSSWQLLLSFCEASSLSPCQIDPKLLLNMQWLQGEAAAAKLARNSYWPAGGKYVCMYTLMCEREWVNSILSAGLQSHVMSSGSWWCYKISNPSVPVEFSSMK